MLYGDSGAIELIVSRLTDPVLNPTEPWAELVLADLSERAPEWRELIVLLRNGGSAARRASVPARTLGDADAVRRVVTAWLAKAADGGGGPDGEFDSFNRPALVGLVRLAARLPGHADTVGALGALVERLPVRTAVAPAAIRVLSRLQNDCGRAELERLAECVTHKSTSTSIRKALVKPR